MVPATNKKVSLSLSNISCYWFTPTGYSGFGIQFQALFPNVLTIYVESLITALTYVSTARLAEPLRLWFVIFYLAIILRGGRGLMYQVLVSVCMSGRIFMVSAEYHSTRLQHFLVLYRQYGGRANFWRGEALNLESWNVHGRAWVVKQCAPQMFEK